jgi:hypothetical protein
MGNMNRPGRWAGPGSFHARRATVAINAMIFGAALIGVGVYGFVSTGSTHPTALIPAGIGAVLAGLGAVALQGGAVRKHAMHVAAAVGLLGFVGTVPGVVTFAKMMTTSAEDQVKAGVSDAKTPQEVREEDQKKSTQFQAAVYKTVTAALCLVFVGFCVKSFVDARVARQATSPPTAGPPEPTPV